MTHTLEFKLHELIPYVNWTYFFHAWSIPQRFSSITQVHDCPGCLSAWTNTFNEADREAAGEVIRLYKDARDFILKNGEKSAYAKFGIYVATSLDESVFIEDTEKGRTLEFPFLRQQTARTSEPFLCWADFIVPTDKKALYPQGARGTQMGVFAATAGEELAKQEEDDAYWHMMAQTIADRMAEAAAERMHELVRKVYWGYSPNESLSPQELFSEKYEGRRPAVGYPSLPDISLNFLIDECIEMGDIGISLTENGMMQPHASVSGLLFDHPACRHFAIGKIGEDQLETYSAKRGVTPEDIRKFLARNL